MTFDKTNAKNKDIVDWFKNKKTLILETAPMNRTTIKKTLINFGVDKNKFFIPETYLEAKEIIDLQRPDIIFIRDVIEEDRGFDLLDLHVKTIPNRLNSAFFIITDDNSPSSSCMVLDTEVDGILALPFTGSSINKLLIQGLKRKYKPNPYIRMIEEAKAKIIEGNVEEAIAQFKEAGDMNKTPVLSNYHIAKIHIENSDSAQGEKILKENLELNAKHYKTLKELAKLYKNQSRFKDQYEMSSSILENYALNPEQIPDLTKLSIQNEKYEDIWNYSKVFSKVKTQSSKIRQFISAGLAICGRFMVKTNRTEEGKKAIVKSAKLANGKIEILKNLVMSLYQINDKESAQKILSDYTNSNTDEEALEILNFELFAKDSLTPQTLERGRKILNSGFKSPEIYKIMIHKLVIGNAKKETIEDMLFDAKKDFPEYDFPTLDQSS
jgi:tetratricopeptide (TPR) repeat protein